jgi:glutathione gamma-glutamylcysteinyltransferase
MAETLYRRPLPDDLVAFSSAAGQALFGEALARGGLQGYFALAEQFHTQADPAFCGLGSLVVALNALGIDPGRLWKGPWRWYSEELLDCCVAHDTVRARGITLDELACLARCNGAEAELHRAGGAERVGPEALRSMIAAAASGDGSVVIAAYDRSGLGQTGAGHFSPVGGYHAARDLALVLDVARFKYPPHWVAVDRLHAAMEAHDPSVGRSRGWLVLRRRPTVAALWSFNRPEGRHDLQEMLARLEAAVSAAADPVAGFVATARAEQLGLAVRAAPAPEHAALAERLVGQLRASPAYRTVAAHATEAAEADEIAGLLLVLAERLATAVGGAHEAPLRGLGDVAALPPELAAEVCHMRMQLEALVALP